MDKHILVAYASKYGGTEEIAERIGEVLRQAGLDTDVLPAGRVSDLAPYRAVVLGSGVYMGAWRKEAARFLKANEQALTDRLVWVFSSGPTGEGDPEELADGWRFPAGLRPVAQRIQPRDTVVFHGVLDEKKLNLFQKWIINRVGAPLGDFRDWDAIAAWATGIAEALKETEPASA
jgi:menaquinone-dependent protoporphyrinogen oxidase